MRGALLLLSVVVLVLQACSTESRQSDSVWMAMESNRAKFAAADQREAAEFLVEMADARMMDGREGEVARDRGVHADVKAYGEVMVRDQAMLLAEIQALAASEGIFLPDRISNAKASGLASLMGKTGEDVDSTFISMICIDHERDVKEFREATELADPEVRAFAARRLEMIEQHLAEAKAIKERL